MTAVLKHKLTAAEYLEIERQAEIKSEFYDGEMFAMSGGTYRHSRLRTNLVAIFEAMLSGKRCRATDSDLRVRIESTDFYTYPDLSISCGRVEFEDEKQDVLLNPTVVIEVLSDSTASYDRGKKFWHYRHIASLTDYVLVSHDEPLIEHYTRQDNGGWLLRTVEGEAGLLRIDSIGCEIPLREIYRDIDPPGE